MVEPLGTFIENGVKLTFIYETYHEEDDTWDCLCVSINDGIFRMAKPIFGTEDTDKIREYVRKNVSDDW